MGLIKIGAKVVHDSTTDGAKLLAKTPRAQGAKGRRKRKYPGTAAGEETGYWQNDGMRRLRRTSYHHQVD